MIRNLCLAAILLAFSLTSCSSPPPKKTTPTTTPTTTQPAAKTETPAPPTPKPADPTKPDATKAETPKPADPAAEKKEEPKAEAPKTETPKPAVSAKDAPLGKETGFESENVAGKTVRAWIADLSSKDKDKLIEAFEVLKMVGKRASLAAPKLEALTQNPDAEIAAGAREALQAVKTKD